MIGRQVIPTKQAFTLESLEKFLQAHWDKREYNDFMIGRPTPASVEEYILLPATERYMVIVFPRKAGGLFNKENKVVLSVCDTPEGIRDSIITMIPTHNIFFGIRKISKTMSREQERKGPAEEVLQKYTAYLRGLLVQAGYAKA